MKFFTVLNFCFITLCGSFIELRAAQVKEVFKKIVCFPELGIPALPPHQCTDVCKDISNIDVLYKHIKCSRYVDEKEKCKTLMLHGIEKFNMPVSDFHLILGRFVPAQSCYNPESYIYVGNDSSFLQYCLESGLDPNAKIIATGKAMILEVCSAPAARLLLKYGAKLDWTMTTISDRSFLHDACFYSKDLDLVKIGLQYIDPNLKDYSGKVPLQMVFGQVIFDPNNYQIEAEQDEYDLQKAIMLIKAGALLSLTSLPQSFNKAMCQLRVISNKNSANKKAQTKFEYIASVRQKLRFVYNLQRKNAQERLDSQWGVQNKPDILKQILAQPSYELLENHEIRAQKIFGK